MARGARETRAEAERSFEQLYRGHRGEVYRAALRELGNAHDAEDVTQAAFVDAYRAVLRGTRPQAPRAWLLTIAENVRRRRYRSSRLRPREEPLDAEAAIAAEESHEQAVALLEALEALTPEQRDAFLLREIAGLSYDEIAARTGSTVGSVQMLLFRARKSLRQELEPPQVQPLLIPLVTLFSRAEHFRAAPRVAGAVGALALAVGVGSSSSVPAQAEPPQRAQERAQERKVAAAPAALPAPQRVLAAQRTAVSRPRAPRVRAVTPPPSVASGAAIATPTPVPAVAPAETPSRAPSEPPPAPAPAEPLPAAESASPATAVETTTLAVPIVEPVVAAVPVPAPPAVPVEELLESAGAAGAAGADAPPLPELPLDQLPPVP